MSYLVRYYEDLWPILGVPHEVTDFVWFSLQLLHVFLALVLAGAVYVDSRRRSKSGGQIVLVPGFVWSLIVLATRGYAGAFAYWLVHYSSLRYQGGKTG